MPLTFLGLFGDLLFLLSNIVPLSGTSEADLFSKSTLKRLKHGSINLSFSALGKFHPLAFSSFSSVFHRDDDRLTPIFHAAIHGCPVTIDTLLHYGADINSLEKNRVSRVLP